MAVRRDILCSLGGFDEAYRYYLDETDLNWRLHLSGYKTLLVPLAQVVHGFAPAAHRGPERRCLTSDITLSVPLLDVTSSRSFLGSFLFSKCSLLFLVLQVLSEQFEQISSMA